MTTLAGPAGAHARPSRRPRVTPRRVALYVLLIALALLYLMPVYVVLVSSFKTLREVNDTSIWAPPAQFDPSAWGAALTPPLQNAGGIASGLANSLLMTVPAVIVSSLWGAVNGYALSAWRFRGSELLFGLILFGLFIPYQAILIPLLTTLQFVRLYDSLAGLALVHIIYGLPITCLLYTSDAADE